MIRSRYPALSVVVAILSAIFMGTSAVAAPVAEVEPNDNRQQAVPLYRGQSGIGNINTGAEFDLWALPNVRRTDSVFLYTATSTSTTSGDSIMSAFIPGADPSTTTNATFYDDDSGPNAVGGFSSSTINGVTPPSNGALLVRVDGFGSSTLTPYQLFQAVLGPSDFGPETEPNDTFDTAMFISSAGINAQGGSDNDFYKFFANPGDTIVALVDNNPQQTGTQSSGTPFKSALSILGTDGSTVLSTTASFTAAHNGTGKSNTAGPVVATVPGFYFVSIANGGTVNGPYRLVVLVNGDVAAPGACCSGTSCDLRSAGNCNAKFMGVGTSCQGDQDGDGVEDDCDNCRQVSNLSQEDSDDDGSGNSCDGCPNDATKLVPGQCGCGVLDTDRDRDGTADCNDQCPDSALKVTPGVCGCNVADTDSDGDGTPNCTDLCPTDARKSAPGVCGCGVAETDTDGDRTLDCKDSCASDPRKTAPGVCGCGVADVDANQNGVIDCLAGADLKKQIQAAVDRVAAIKLLPSRPSKAQRAAHTAEVSAVKTLLAALTQLTQQVNARVTITNPKVNLTKNLSSFVRLATQTLGAREKAKFSRKRSAAVKAGKKIVAAIA